jgi:hypothetical protein
MSGFSSFEELSIRNLEESGYEFTNLCGVIRKVMSDGKIKQD